MIKTLIFLLLTVSGSFSVLGQSCGTPPPLNPTVYSSFANARGASSSLCIDIVYHIVRNTDGSNPYLDLWGESNLKNLDEITGYLNSIYSPHNIFINNAGSTFIDNTDFVSIEKGEELDLIQVNNHSNAINFYIVYSMGNIAGTAITVPSTSLVIENLYAMTSVTQHELGHCLNLAHTHEIVNGVELIDGSNCSVAGDRVCDTPADPKLDPISCVYTGGGGYTPLTDNIMSYSGYWCRKNFTAGQGQRMRTAIANHPTLQGITSNGCVKISKVDDNVCFPQTRTITLTDLGGASTTWSSSTNVLINSSNNSSATFSATTNNVNGMGWIRATLNDRIQLTEEFWVGRPTSIGGSISGPSTATIGQLVTYTHSNPVGPNGGTYDWTLPYDVKFCSPNCWSVFTGGDGNNQIRAIAGSSSGYVQIRKTNACGNGGAKILYVTVPSGGGGGGGIEIQAIVSPNPVDTPELKITFVSKVTGDPLDLADFGYEVEYTIRNMQGNVKHQSKSKKKKKKININKLEKNKQYILTIKYGDKGHENIHVYIE